MACHLLDCYTVYESAWPGADCIIVIRVVTQDGSRQKGKASTISMTCCGYACLSCSGIWRWQCASNAHQAVISKHETDDGDGDTSDSGGDDDGDGHGDEHRSCPDRAF